MYSCLTQIKIGQNGILKHLTFLFSKGKAFYFTRFMPDRNNLSQLNSLVEIICSVFCINCIIQYSRTIRLYNSNFKYSLKLYLTDRRCYRKGLQLDVLHSADHYRKFFHVELGAWCVKWVSIQIHMSGNIDFKNISRELFIMILGSI